jgi:hypothetical protein
LPASILLVCLSLASCATDPAKEREAWQGATYDEVAGKWGPPAHSSKTADGTDVHVWVSQSPSAQPRSSIGVGIFGGSGGGFGLGGGAGVSIPVGESGEPDRCERRMYFRDARVVDQEWLGPPAYCSLFSRL